MSWPFNKDPGAEADLEARQRIAEAARKSATILSLAGLRLTSLPPEIWSLKGLTMLDLRRNRLTALPPEIGALTALTSLDLHNNQLTALPPEIGSLTALMSLDLHNNKLTGLPPEIGALTALTRLDLYINKLTALSSEIGSLKALTKLYLENNQLTALPPEIGSLKALKSLDVRHNKLSALPSEIGSLKALTELYLHGNAALGIPDSILGPTLNDVSARVPVARARDILNFYFDRQQAEAAGTLRPIREIKVMLVGRGGAGKTSLRRFFLGQPHDADEKETPGIALDTFPLICRRGKLTVRLWDFAGQEITHALHQFFLTEGCIYLLVLDPRSNTEMQDAEYWLGLLQRYAGDSPVLLVLNRQDARQGGYAVDRRMLREQFRQIHSFTATNCANRDGCDNLLRRLCEAVKSLPHTEPPHLHVPETWLNVTHDCDRRATERQHLTLNEFRKICEQRGEQKPHKQESLARLLHKLGVVLHFVDEPRLRDTTVLDPHWVTDGVYRLLRFKDGPNSNGVLSLPDALQALPGEDKGNARFLLRLMERFEMCFPLERESGEKQPTKWLIPGALDAFQPAGVTDNWQRSGVVRMRYVYDPLPEGVLPRFIVRTHLLSEQQPRWRNGVVLTDGRARALVRRGANRNHVEVTAFGPRADRLRLLQIVQGNMERIHTDLPEPKPYAEVELAGAPGVFRPVADLKVAERNELLVAIDFNQHEQLIEPTPELNRTSELFARNNKHVPLKAFLSYSHKDKRAKQIFQDNLAVMQQKNLIAQWHDGLIETGMLWKEEIEENLARMDVFVGLLTTAFLASDFIREVELEAAKAKLNENERDFLFVLILVDDIPLAGLDLAAYQILKPGGKAVAKHPSHRVGFNEAQKELEKLILDRQPKQSKGGAFHPRSGET